MNYELLTIIALIVLIILVVAEFLWLSNLSERQEASVIKNKKVEKNTQLIFNGVLSAPTLSARKDEVDLAEKYWNADDINKESVCKTLLQILPKKEEYIEGKQQALNLLYERLNPIAYYKDMLDNGNTSKKGYACMQLAEFKATECIEDIRPLLDKKSRQLKYNAGMSLAILGDEEGTKKFLNLIQNDREYSYRIINEVIDRYSGDLYSLTSSILEICDDYIKSVILKSIGKFKIPEMLDYILECTRDTNQQIKIASARALSYYDDSRIEHDLIVLSLDNNWVIRENAIRGLGNFTSDEALNAVVAGIKDKEWWVRQEAAKSLVKMDKSLVHIEKVIKGYDRYASDAVKYSLYKILDLEEEQ